MVRNPTPNHLDERTDYEASSGPWWFVGIGGALVASGAIMGSIAAYNADQFGEATILSEKKEIREMSERQALVADLLYGAGAVSVLTGLVWYALDDPPEAMPRVDVNSNYLGVSWSSAF